MYRSVVRLSLHRFPCRPIYLRSLQGSSFSTALVSPGPGLHFSSGRNFTSSSALQKKKDKGKKSLTAESDVGSIATEDPFDLSQLHSGISAAASRLKDELSKLRAGGRFNTALIEGLKVQLGKETPDMIRLRDLAQVVPKGGRLVAVLVAEEEHIKPVTSAIVSSNLSLTPQPDSHNSLQLNIPIPPPTKESRAQSVQAAKQAYERATSAIRDSRGTMHKRLQDMQKKKVARPDDVRKAHEQMEKATDKGQKEVKDLFDAAKKSLEQV